ncbi:hypothetical protein KO500_09190 [Cellulophaga baltica]|uniref:DUF6048 family protein n=1 Tax=Cellulophaga TaxID=104264 RepID=UPI001C07589B|nr:MULTISPECIES: DUF6048 family protein [Cellulophaga]MBU2996609.1 hypothetical protein [Cellulophaga baltica]MDO6768003.1 DUF6048 family protein [Cellulophaga sp. 1_MG-2023]
MLKYTFSIAFLCIAFFANAQSGPIDVSPKDTIQKTEAYGVRVGIDLSKILTTSLDDNYTGLEIVGDYRISQNLYLAAELGNEKKTTEEDTYNFTTSGSYIKAGVDYNTYENWFGMTNIINLGGRIGVSSFSQTLNEYSIYSSNRYFYPDDYASGSITTAQEFDGRSAVWLEVVMGAKVELFANIYLGASVRIGALVSNKEDDDFPNLWIPGFNKVTDNTIFGASYNYTVSYLIPLYKKKKKVREKYVDEGDKERKENSEGGPPQN